MRIDPRITTGEPVPEAAKDPAKSIEKGAIEKKKVDSAAKPKDAVEARLRPPADVSSPTSIAPAPAFDATLDEGGRAHALATLGELQPQLETLDASAPLGTQAAFDFGQFDNAPADFALWGFDLPAIFAESEAALGGESALGDDERQAVFDARALIEAHIEHDHTLSAAKTDSQKIALKDLAAELVQLTEPAAPAQGPDGPRRAAAAEAAVVETKAQGKPSVGRKTDAERLRDGEIVIPGPAMVRLERLSHDLMAQFAGMDVAELAQLVMMQCAKEQTEELRELLAEMKQASTRKAQIREYQTKAKAERARLEHEIREEYDYRTSLDPSNSMWIDPSQVKFDEYAKQREIAGNVADPSGEVPSRAPVFSLTADPPVISRREAPAAASRATQLTAARGVGGTPLTRAEETQDIQERYDLSPEQAAAVVDASLAYGITADSMAQIVGLYRQAEAAGLVRATTDFAKDFASFLESSPPPKGLGLSKGDGAGVQGKIATYVKAVESPDPLSDDQKKEIIRHAQDEYILDYIDAQMNATGDRANWAKNDPKVKADLEAARKALKDDERAFFDSLTPAQKKAASEIASAEAGKIKTELNDALNLAASGGFDNAMIVAKTVKIVAAGGAAAFDGGVSSGAEALMLGAIVNGNTLPGGGLSWKNCPKDGAPGQYITPDQEPFVTFHSRYPDQKDTTWYGLVFNNNTRFGARLLETLQRRVPDFKDKTPEAMAHMMGDCQSRWFGLSLQAGHTWTGFGLPKTSFFYADDGRDPGTELRGSWTQNKNHLNNFLNNEDGVFEEKDLVTEGWSADDSPPELTPVTIAVRSETRTTESAPAPAAEQAQKLTASDSPPAPRGMTLGELDASLEAWDNKKQSIADLSEQLQLKLQMTMDRRAKMFELLSNLMKKSSSTGDAIIANTK